MTNKLQQKIKEIAEKIYPASEFELKYNEVGRRYYHFQRERFIHDLTTALSDPELLRLALEEQVHREIKEVVDGQKIDRSKLNQSFDI